ncbi:hypothetical protein ACOSP7_001529 [Xanthoceras sorbifolium]
MVDVQRNTRERRNKLDSQLGKAGVDLSELDTWSVSLTTSWVMPDYNTSTGTIGFSFGQKLPQTGPPNQPLTTTNGTSTTFGHTFIYFSDMFFIHYRIAGGGFEGWSAAPACVPRVSGIMNVDNIT